MLREEALREKEAGGRRSEPAPAWLSKVWVDSVVVERGMDGGRSLCTVGLWIPGGPKDGLRW